MRARTAVVAVKATVRLLLLLAALTEGMAAGATETPTQQELVARELPAVVSIAILRARSLAATAAPANAAGAAMPSTSGPADPPPAPRGRRVLGSGFIVDPSGIIVTNRHVVEGATAIVVTLQDNTLLRATLLAQADQIDVALIKVKADRPLPSVRFGDSDAVRVADQVVAIGNPLGLGGTVTRGIVSALNRDIRDTPFDDYIQTDAAINHGNSGGPLFDERGEVIGMNTALFAPETTSGSVGLGFAIPSNDVKFAADALLSPGGLRLGTLDFRIQQVTPELADALNMTKAEGVIVGGTTKGGGASKCGILPGDIVLSYGNMPVKDVRALARAIARTPPGTRVPMRIWHDDEPIIVTAEVKELPQATASTPPGLVPAPAAIGLGWQLQQGPAGVVVSKVAPGGTASEAGVKNGDVIVQVQQQTVTEPDEVVRVMALAQQQQRHYLAVLVQRDIEGLRWLSASNSGPASG